VPLGVEGGGDSGGRFELDLVPLAVVEGERVAGESFAAGVGETGGGIEAAAEEADGGTVVGGGELRVDYQLL